jgi:hypothetical protein
MQQRFSGSRKARSTRKDKQEQDNPLPSMVDRELIKQAGQDG